MPLFVLCQVLFLCTRRVRSADFVMSGYHTDDDCSNFVINSSVPAFIPDRPQFYHMIPACIHGVDQVCGV